VDLAPNDFEFGSTVLIVGKVTWGADGTTPDKVDIYLPDTGLNLGSVKSTVSAIIDQSTLDTIAFTASVYSPGNNYYNIDEIRFGAGYNDVVAGGAPPSYDNWASGGEAFGGDANGDGVADGMAWILGAASPSANARGMLPVAAKDGAFLTLNFKRTNAYAPAKLYVQYCKDMTGWTEYEIPASSNPNIGAGIEVTVTNDLPNPDQVTVKVPTALQSTKGTLFVRLRAAN
jgi:hypothetical protein